MPPVATFALPAAPNPTRRAVLRALAAASGAALLPPSAGTPTCKQSGPDDTPPDLSDASVRADVRHVATTLRAECAAYIAAVRPLSAHALLWRGRDAPVPAAAARDAPRADLLDAATYGAVGAAFFRALDARAAAAPPGLQLPRAGVAHLGTGCRADAAQWGVAVAVWPRGDMRFASRDAGLVYDPAVDGDSPRRADAARGPLRPRALRDALARGDEVLFECDGWYAVSAAYLPAVLDALAEG